MLSVLYTHVFKIQAFDGWRWLETSEFAEGPVAYSGVRAAAHVEVTGALTSAAFLFVEELAAMWAAALWVF